MNERIRELARKANMVEVEYSPGFPDIRYPKNFEKFAELIVRECQHRVEQYINECGEIASMPKSVIMKHFGVEE